MRKSTFEVVDVDFDGMTIYIGRSLFEAVGWIVLNNREGNAVVHEAVIETISYEQVWPIPAGRLEGKPEAQPVVTNWDNSRRPFTAPASPAPWPDQVVDGPNASPAAKLKQRRTRTGSSPEVQRAAREAEAEEAALRAEGKADGNAE